MPGKSKFFAQRIDQIPAVVVTDGAGARAEHNEARWPSFGLGDVIDA